MIMKKLVFLCFLLPLLSSCKALRTIYIAHYTVDCQGVAPQKCMLVKESPENDWTNFYDTIDGFSYEEGYEYQLEVEVSKIANPPADASALRYTLKRIISKTQQQLPLEIEYSAITRGFNLNLKINKEHCLITRKNLAKAPIKLKKETIHWQRIQDIVKAINLPEIKNLKSPTTERFYDAAAIAAVIIKKGDSTYTSSSFDHGTPPKALQQLMDELSLYLRD